jgi:hypothetical protein
MLTAISVAHMRLALGAVEYRFYDDEMVAYDRCSKRPSGRSHTCVSRTSRGEVSRTEDRLFIDDSEFISQTILLDSEAFYIPRYMTPSRSLWLEDYPKE